MLFEATGALRRETGMQPEPHASSTTIFAGSRTVRSRKKRSRSRSMRRQREATRGPADLAKRYLDRFPKGNFRAKAERVLARTGE